MILIKFSISISDPSLQLIFRFLYKFVKSQTLVQRKKKSILLNTGIMIETRGFELFDSIDIPSFEPFLYIEKHMKPISRNFLIRTSGPLKCHSTINILTFLISLFPFKSLYSHPSQSILTIISLSENSASTLLIIWSNSSTFTFCFLNSSVILFPNLFVRFL